ncbi:RNA polymerase sigma-70 factor, sigma-E family [Micromonospora pallida]|uniref:RNA polymerase sigma-70 factor, sigma-E family n=1 Tax=Micromonospora pallida TaxID=145854 RepID=A0A1C6TC24_9ACTN|nr:SigE family RNA polymerase sigma factor [Micromonospora pallida]SCL39311.1 RNA polymerase sigma-70 factor, sigma-E family [Micromonospora pallida]
MPAQDRYSGFREFVVARGAALSSAAYLLTGNHQTAEDLLQEALAKTAVRWRRVESGGNPEAYVRRVMLNQLRSWLRRRRYPQVPLDSAADPAADVDMAGRVAQRIAMSQILASLPPRQRAVLYLRFYEDLSETATANLLGCRVGTIKRHAHDGLAALRRAYPHLSDTSTTSEVVP